MNDMSEKILEKQILRIVEAPLVPAGNGGKAYSVIGHEKLNSLDPFAVMDDYEVSLPHGYPDHAHRGFEVVGTVLEGSFRYEDFLGDSGVLEEGDVEFVVAGRGLMHTEMPNPHVRGLQLWINLKSVDKDVEPSALKLKKRDVSRRERDGVSVAIIGGVSMDNQAPIRTRNSSIHYYDFTVKPGASYSQHVPNGWNCFAYTVSGGMQFNGTPVDEHHTVIFGDGEVVRFENKGTSTARFVLLGGKPLQETMIIEEGHVLNSKEELEKTLEDIRSCANGFENAKGWKSKIGSK